MTTKRDGRWIGFAAVLLLLAALIFPLQTAFAEPVDHDLDGDVDGADLSALASHSGSAQTIYDPYQRVYWIADANLAGNATLGAQLGVTGINPNGTMNYTKALEWVAALNAYDNGRGYLEHNNWQLPVTPRKDDTCAVPKGGDGNSSGPSCTGSALGSLYSVFLGHTYPDSVVPTFTNKVAPFHNLQPQLYCSKPDSESSGGQPTFSFNIGTEFANTVKYNFMHVLPMRRGV
jgi:hypothetical protein